MVQLFYEEHPELASTRTFAKLPLGIVVDAAGQLVHDPSGKLSNEAVLSKLMATVEKAGVRVPFDHFLQNTHTAEDQDSDGVLRLSTAKSSGKLVDMLDKEIHRSVAERFVGSTRETIDRNKLSPSNKVYIAQWTNRVAIWRFFERYVSPVVVRHLDEIKDDIRYHADAFVELGGARPNEIRLVNPFAQYGHAFKVVMNAWMPCIKKVVKLFVSNTRGGFNLQEDFQSISYMAFLHALEKQAMAILGNSKQAQGIPFPKRLEFAVRKSIYSDLPDLTGPVRVPVESKQRKNMPQEVSLDSWNDDDF